MRALLSSDIAASLGLHALKVGIAFFINWLVLRQFPVSEFVVWSVTSSVLMIATASDLGIGQYTVTQLIGVERGRWSQVVSDSLVAMLPLMFVGAVFVYLAVPGSDPLYRMAMAAMLALRILSIPFGAALNAANQFKVRKAIEVVSYLLAGACIAALGWYGRDVHLAVLALNAAFFLGAILTVWAAWRRFSLQRVIRKPDLQSARRVFRAAIPFMANNLSGLLTYGGFIWLASLVLPKDDVAKLAILHGFVLVNAYQLYDVALKARQADLADPNLVRRYALLNWLVVGSAPVAFLLLAPMGLGVLGSPVAFSRMELLLFGLFLAAEMANLFLQSVVQVDPKRYWLLKVYAMARLSIIAAFALPLAVPTNVANELDILLGAMIAASSLTAFLLVDRFVNRNPFIAKKI